MVHPKSNSFKGVQLLLLRNYLSPLSFTFPQDLRMRVLIFFKYLEVLIASKVLLVIRVHRRSKELRETILRAENSLVKPLSVIRMHLHSFRCRRLLRWGESAMAERVALEESVQLRSRSYKFLQI